MSDDIQLYNDVIIEHRLKSAMRLMKRHTHIQNVTRLIKSAGWFKVANHRNDFAC